MNIPVFHRLRLGVLTSTVLLCTWIGAASSALVACQSSPGEGNDSKVGPKQAEVVKTQFPLQVPEGYQSLLLRGEGSEFLKAPSGAQVVESNDEFRVQAGADFQLVVRTVAPSLKDVASSRATGEVVLRADDALIVKESKGYSFVVIRQLVPQWDESDRRQYSCSSPGALTKGVPLTTFGAVEVGAMVAACRTLSLPVLE